jgi:ABC-type spermidine/putrescine transport system permease subunit I
MSVVGLKRKLRDSKLWILPIYLFLIIFVIFPLVRLFIDSFTTADIQLSALNEVALTTDLLEEKVNAGEMGEALAAAHDIALQLNRSIDVVGQMIDALGRATFSQHELIAEWQEAQDKVAQEAAAMAELQEDPVAALAQARKSKALVHEIVRLPRRAFSVDFFLDVFRDRLYMKALGNSLLLGLATVATTSVIGFAVAYLLVRYDFPGRRAYNFLTTIPIVMPPLVGVLGFIFILGRGGTVNELFYQLADALEKSWPAVSNWLYDRLPFNFIYGCLKPFLVLSIDYCCHLPHLALSACSLPSSSVQVASGPVSCCPHPFPVANRHLGAARSVRRVAQHEGAFQAAQPIPAVGSAFPGQVQPPQEAIPSSPSRTCPVQPLESHLHSPQRPRRNLPKHRWFLLRPLQRRKQFPSPQRWTKASPLQTPSPIETFSSPQAIFAQ